MPAIPAVLRWLGTPAECSVDAGTIRIGAGARTDWFVEPETGAATLNAPALVGVVDGDYQLSARVEPLLASTYDAASLVLWRDPGSWAKLAVELSPDGDRTIVSVVTRSHSDDCTARVVGPGPVRLRVARLGAAFAFHAALADGRWEFVRHFRLGSGDPAAVGFEVQSPLGEGCTATFSEIGFVRARLRDLRDHA